MTITLPPELAKRLQQQASLNGTTPEAEAVQSIQASLPNQDFISAETLAWLARLTAHATDCGVSLTDEELSREVMYES